jgi:hypothetical protein
VDRKIAQDGKMGKPGILPKSPSIASDRQRMPAEG